MITETKLYAGEKVIAEMKTIKIIDLLLKISKDEEVPKRIKYKNKIYHYRGDDYSTYDENWLFSENYTEKTAWLKDFLNEEVEILDELKDNFTGWKMYQDGEVVCSMDCSPEEDKTIEKIKVDDNGYIQSKIGAWKGRLMDLVIIDKINELIDEVNKLI